MKKKNLLLLVPITLSAAAFLGYRAWDRMQVDNTPPTISISTETVQVSVSDPQSALLQGITARDDREGDVTDSLLVESISMRDGDGTIEVTFAAFDQSGNVARGTRTARYTDYESPRFNLKQPLLFPYGSNFDILAAISANDPLDGNIQHRIRAMGLDDSSVSAPGTHQIEFRVTNSMGDTVRLTLPVEVYTADAYELNLELTDYLIYLKAGSTFDAAGYLSQVSRGVNKVSLEEGVPEEYAVQVTGKVDTQVPGIYPVNYTITYSQPTASGTQYQTGLSRLIVIVEE